MLTSFITRLVIYATRRPWNVIAVGLLLALASGWYVATHFAINTDIGKLIRTDQAWARNDAALSAAFPNRDQMILAVVEAPAAELADAAADELAQALRAEQGRFRAVGQPGGGTFFERNGLLFPPTDTVGDITQQLVQARPLMNTLAHDPTLRGLADTLNVTLALPLQLGQVKLPDMARLLSTGADTVEAVLAGKRAALSWRALMEDATPTGGKVSEKGVTPAVPASAAAAARPPRPAVAHSFVAVSPVLNYTDLQAGAKASAAIRDAAARLHLGERYEAEVHLTGAQALADDEFASVKEGAILNSLLTLLVVIAILWFALRSKRLITAVLLNLLVGLAITAALGLMMVGALNMISVAFAVLFVGLGVDFGIQFGVRYRAERHDHEYQVPALANTGRAMAVPLSLAATATAAAFFSFVPTDYRGVAELGKIAGFGMLVAFVTTITLLPALIRVFRPHNEPPSPPGFTRLAAADTFFENYRKPVLLVTCGAILAASPLLLHLRFDADPLHLKDPSTESMATLLALRGSPDDGTQDVNVMAPSLSAAQALAARLEALPEVARVVTLQTFIPADQPTKLKAIATAAQSLLPVLTQAQATPASDAQRVNALKNVARSLALAADEHPGPGAAEALRLAKALRQLAAADAAMRDRADRAIALPLRLGLARLRTALQPEPVSQATLPPELVRDWLAPGGQALVNISPRLPAGDDEARRRALDRFIDAVLDIAPNAVGGPISIRGSADTILTAFKQAGVWAVLAIAGLLWLTLRRFGDVLRTLVPLLVSALVTLELCVAFGIPLNFANVIALPLLLGIGVAFKIYYVMAWREGETRLLQSSLTHAVLFSAATTATAFGSLWLSRHPGTASMGKLLALALVCTLIGAVFFQPILMGRPREQADGEPAHHPGSGTSE